MNKPAGLSIIKESISSFGNIFVRKTFRYIKNPKGIFYF